MHFSFNAEIPRGGINFSGSDENEITFIEVEVRVDYEPAIPSSDPANDDQIMAMHAHDPVTGELLATYKHEDAQLEALAWQYIQISKKGVAA